MVANRIFNADISNLYLIACKSQAALLQQYYVSNQLVARRNELRSFRFFASKISHPLHGSSSFAKSHARARLFGCKRPHHGSLSLPTFCKFESSTPTSENAKISFSCGLDTSSQTSHRSRRRFLFQSRRSPTPSLPLSNCDPHTLGSQLVFLLPLWVSFLWALPEAETCYRLVASRRS